MIALRVATAVLMAVQASITAYLAFGDLVPQTTKIALVVASAGLAVLLNQLPRPQDKPQASDGSWASSPKPPPRG